MPSTSNENAYLRKVKNWKARNMIARYLEAREKFKDFQRSLRSGDFPSFDKLRDICEILFEIKEEHHLVYKKLIDPKKNRFEKGHKLMPGEVETRFMNNIGLLFHKVMVTRELKYVMEYYVEKDDTFDKNEESMQWHLQRIDALFDDGIDILTSMILGNHDNILLVTLFIEDTAKAKRHFGKNFRKIIQNFCGNKGLAEVYYKVGNYYMECGWNPKAKKMFRAALKEDTAHKRSRVRLRNLA